MREVAARAAAIASVADSTTTQASGFRGSLARGRGFDERSGQRLFAMQVKAQRHARRAFDPVDADFAIALRGVCVSGGKKRAAIQHGQVQARAGAKIAHVHVAAENAGRAGAKFAGFGRSDAHYAAERAKRDDGGSERTADGGFELPVEKIRVGEAFLEKAKPRDHTGPSPAFVRHFEHVHLQDIARFGPVDKNRSGESVNAVAVYFQVLGESHAGAHLGAARVLTFEVNGVAGSDGEARLQIAIPTRVNGFGGERVFGHGDGLALHFDCHLELDESVARQRRDTDGGPHVAARFAK